MKTIEDLGDLAGQRVLVRSDLNVPIKDEVIGDDGRIRASLPTLIKLAKAGAKVIVMEPFYDRKLADFVATRTGAQVLVLPPSVGGVKGVDDYVSVMRHDIGQLASALR